VKKTSRIIFHLIGKINAEEVEIMNALPCFADCIHARDGDCVLDIIGSDRLGEVECACEFYKAKNRIQDS